MSEIQKALEERATRLAKKSKRSPLERKDKTTTDYSLSRPAVQLTDDSRDEVGCDDTRDGTLEPTKQRGLHAEKAEGKVHGPGGGVSNEEISRALTRANFAVIM